MFSALRALASARNFSASVWVARGLKKLNLSSPLTLSPLQRPPHPPKHALGDRTAAVWRALALMLMKEEMPGEKPCDRPVVAASSVERPGLTALRILQSAMGWNGLQAASCGALCGMLHSNTRASSPAPEVET